MKEKDELQEIMKQLERPVDGFRKGITKKGLLRSLTDEDWQHIESVKEAEERMTNELSYQFFLASDQAVASKEKIEADLINQLSDLLAIDFITDKNEVDIAKGGRIKTDDEPKASVKELEINNLKNSSQGMRIISLMKKDLARLYSFVGRMGLDRKVFYEEKDYNDFAKNIIRKLEGTRFKLLK